MKKLSLALLVVENNDYQAEQVIAANAAAQRLGIQLQVIHTEHDAILQGQRVLTLLQSSKEARPDGILFEPVGTPLVQAAKMAAELGIGWVVLNREHVEYLPQLRQLHPTPMFSVTSNHTEVGRIQGEQVARLLPKGGTVLYIQGAAGNDATAERGAGMLETKPSNVEVRALRGVWTADSGYHATSSWLKLSIAKELNLGAVVAQNDAMALGARKAFEELASRQSWEHLPFLGCDGLPKGGQAAVRNGQMTATIVIPPSAGHAVEALVSALRAGTHPAPCIYQTASSYPPLGSLKPVGQ